MRIIKYIKSFLDKRPSLHIHEFERPLLSRYISFNRREIIYQCRCGARKSERVRFKINEEAPIETNTSISYTQFKDVLDIKNGPCPNCGGGIVDTIGNNYLLTDPPRKPAHCVNCNYKGYIFK